MQDDDIAHYRFLTKLGTCNVHFIEILQFTILSVKANKVQNSKHVNADNGKNNDKKGLFCPLWQSAGHSVLRCF